MGKMMQHLNQRCRGSPGNICGKKEGTRPPAPPDLNVGETPGMDQNRHGHNIEIGGEGRQGAQKGFHKNLKLSKSDGGKTKITNK